MKLFGRRRDRQNAGAMFLFMFPRLAGPGALGAQTFAKSLNQIAFEPQEPYDAILELMGFGVMRYGKQSLAFFFFF
ncbi:hypothetical protein F5X98DRAFT_325035 [Xylaria grammica]|nr:hypothetical protein F5X98DRAFT_325035 [Xylaria grammica]